VRLEFFVGGGHLVYHVDNTPKGYSVKTPFKTKRQGENSDFLNNYGAQENVRNSPA
jgi:hypothetical protein